MKIKKTNALRILDSRHIPYFIHTYSKEAIEKGTPVATQIGVPSDLIYKTIIMEASNEYFVGVIPIDAHIDMKKAAKAFGVKKLDLFHVNRLFELTGYVRGGCSPIGMKKIFPTIIDSQAMQAEAIVVSAGKIGLQMEVSPNIFAELIDSRFEDIIVK